MPSERDVMKESTIDGTVSPDLVTCRSSSKETAEMVHAHAQLRQDLHQNRRERKKPLEVAIGREVRAIRIKQNLSVAQLAKLTELSRSLLSKIENDITLPSLRTLQILARALGVPLTTFFRGFEESRTAVHTKAGEGVDVERAGTRAGHQYNLLGHIGSNASGVVVEPYLITLSEQTDLFPIFQHDGIEMLYVLEGQVDYRHGDNLYALRRGDTLFFDADAPHGPEGLVKPPIRYLSIITYPQASRSA